MSKGHKKKYINVLLLFLCLFLTGITGTIYAQDIDPEETRTDTITTVTDSVYSVAEYDFFANDTIPNLLESTFFQQNDSISYNLSDSPVTVTPDKNSKATKRGTTSFKPIPRKATIASLIFPGLGQIYNRQYWKAPIVFGGIMGCAYAITWNNKTYQDYKNAYYDIIIDAKNDPDGERPETWNQSWQVYIPSSVDPATQLHSSTFHNNLKRNKDYFRRYRDLSYIVGVAIYFIILADAYVDAQMFDFDVSPDLSFRVAPEFRPGTITGARTCGINICMTF